MMSLTFGLFTQVSGSGPLGPLVLCLMENPVSKHCRPWSDSTLCGVRFGSALFANHPLEWVKSGKYYCLSWRGWPAGVMVLGKLPVLGRPAIWITVGQGPTALAVGAGGVCLDIFTLIYPFSPLSPSLRETSWYRLKYCLKGPSNPKQPTNYFMEMQVIKDNL